MSAAPKAGPASAPTPGARGGLAPAEAVTPRQQALARLAASRARLRAQALPAAHDGAAADTGPGLRVWWRLLRRQLGHTPLGLAVVSWLDAWWQRQPLAAAAELGSAELRATVLPMVRRHPVAALAGAAALGAVLVASRRWLWAWAGRRAGAWRGSLGGWVWAQARDPAVQLLVMAWLQQLAAARTPGPREDENPRDGGRTAPPETGG